MCIRDRFTAARRDHLEKTIRPALARGEVVICDRFADSTRIYQGLTRGDLRATVDALHGLMIGQEPDLTFLIDIDAAEGLARATARAGMEMRFETTVSYTHLDVYKRQVSCFVLTYSYNSNLISKYCLL